MLKANRVQAIADRLRSSLFAVPMAVVVFGIVSAQVLVTIDAHLRINESGSRSSATMETSRWPRRAGPVRIRADDEWLVGGFERR